MIMELLEGESLGQRLSRVRCLAVSDVVDFGMQATRVLGAAHDEGIVHGGLHTDNLFLIPDLSLPRGERVEVLDFGTIRLGALTGNEGARPRGAPYLAPEQWGGDGTQIDARTDVYGLGALLYHALCGVPPFVGETPGRAGLPVGEAPTPMPPRMCNADLPPSIEAVILQAMARRPEDRFVSMPALAAALLGVTASIDSSDPRPRARGRRLWVVGALTTAVVLTAVGSWTHQISSGTSQPLLSRRALMGGARGGQG